MSTRYHVSDEAMLEAGLTAATTAIRAGELVVLPTDTVYGLGADAFDPAAVSRLLDAKGRGREMPPPVLVGSPATLDALARDLPSWARVLVDKYWPGPLTVVVRQQTSLQWDLGETRGTVAVRMPADKTALELLARTGPLAVSSANLTGRPAATDADQAAEMLADAVTVILDGGPTADDRPSTIVDCTGAQPRILRIGAIGVDELRDALAEAEVAVAGPDEPEDAGSSGA
ncbi:L-threonylcarbamoyladenylate synthase [Nocardioides marmorisolisilvae]|uniref:L-threonylcarbamoyladenylate synthase n=1 Tax=Nocardioides marmorisolisilvae TaxID=1542737 RepID=A0A3N0DX07_9ACTN|nr:L-threonylcarbamoyladenylate synthase [Nocardioides marmorisolisilvae]RNL80026.1 threonylcarbamoyl-AMP synthase [Nocardioides marmorisolisilvae]